MRASVERYNSSSSPNRSQVQEVGEAMKSVLVWIRWLFFNMEECFMTTKSWGWRIITVPQKKSALVNPKALRHWMNWRAVAAPSLRRGGTSHTQPRNCSSPFTWTLHHPYRREETLEFRVYPGLPAESSGSTCLGSGQLAHYFLHGWGFCFVLFSDDANVLLTRF